MSARGSIEWVYVELSLVEDLSLDFVTRRKQEGLCGSMNVQASSFRGGDGGGGDA